MGARETRMKAAELIEVCKMLNKCRLPFIASIVVQITEPWRFGWPQRTGSLDSI